MLHGLVINWSSSAIETSRNRVNVPPRASALAGCDSKIGQTLQKQGIGFKKIKACFVCKSTDHLIKDCDFYAKRSPEPKLKNVVNTGQRMIKPVWDYAKRVNQQKFSNNLKYPQARRTFVPSGVLTRTSLVNPVRLNRKRAVHTISTARPISTARSISTARFVGIKRPLDDLRVTVAQIKTAERVSTVKGWIKTAQKKDKDCLKIKITYVIKSYVANIKGKKNGRMMLESIVNGPLVYPTIEENSVIRPKKYAELTQQENFQDDCDVQAINIILQGLSPDVYSFVNHCQMAKEIWDIVNLLMQDTELSYQERDDLIARLNKSMAFMSTVVASRFPSTNNQLKTSSNPRNQATIQDGRVTVQQVQGRQGQSFAGTGTKGKATSSRGNNAVGQARVVKCYDCQGEGHMTRQCTKPKRPRNSVWFKEKVLLVLAQESGQVLDEERLAFLADSQIPDDCDDISSAKAVLMANLSSYGLDVLSEKHDVIFVVDEEETLILEEENRSKMLSKQNDPFLKEKKINISPINYNELNKLAEDFEKHFVPHMQLSAEQAFRELNEVKTVFNQMESAIQQCSVDNKYFDIQNKELSLDNDRLWDHIICQDVMNIVMHDNYVPVNVLFANHKCLVDGNLQSERLKQENDHLFELLLSQDIVHICVNSLATLTNYAKMEQDYCNTPKIGSQQNVFPEALLHNTIAQVMRERPLSVVLKSILAKFETPMFHI
ncbi:retrovirus-related pol polyprotein from transposon TNT 1-94 [Tanacetum coccineum]